MIRRFKTIVFLFALAAVFGHNGAILEAYTMPSGFFSDSGYRNIAHFRIPEKGCALVIDLDICTMFVYIDGKIYKAYEVSGGTKDAPSPVGTWRVNKVSNWGEGFGGSWIGLNVPWGKYGIHGTVAPWVIGEYNASHGCIRMKDADVLEIKKLVTYGSLVTIKHDSLAFRPMKNGMVGSDVIQAQKMLQKQGFYQGRLDGRFGSSMEFAVRSFQKTHRLTVDGIVGRATYAKMLEQSRNYMGKSISVTGRSNGFIDEQNTLQMIYFVGINGRLTAQRFYFDRVTFDI